MKKFLSVILLGLFISLCAASTAEPVRIMALKGPTAMGMVQMMEDPGDREFTIVGAIDEVTPALIQGRTDIAAVPANLASVLYNNTDGAVNVLAVNTLGVLYIVDSGDTIHSLEDLRGRTLYASGKGATPEYALLHILSSAGIDPEKDITIEWKSEHAECLAALMAGEGIAMLPQPFVTTAQMKSDNIRVALDLNTEWENLAAKEGSASALLTGVVVARRAFIEEHPEAVSSFLDAYKTSVDFVNANTTEAAELVGKQEIVPTAVAARALPACNIVFIEGEEMQEKLSGYLAVLFSQNPKAVGGKLPDDAFYFKR